MISRTVHLICFSLKKKRALCEKSSDPCASTQTAHDRRMWSTIPLMRPHAEWRALDAVGALHASPSSRGFNFSGQTHSSSIAVQLRHWPPINRQSPTGGTCDIWPPTWEHGITSEFRPLFLSGQVHPPWLWLATGARTPAGQWMETVRL